jgi:hypothetical protein
MAACVSICSIKAQMLHTINCVSKSTLVFVLQRRDATCMYHGAILTKSTIPKKLVMYAYADLYAFCFDAVMSLAVKSSVNTSTDTASILSNTACDTVCSVSVPSL